MSTRERWGCCLQPTRGLGQMSHEPQRLRRQIERGRRSTTFRQRNQALACGTIAEGRLLLIGHGDRCRALAGRRSFHGCDHAVTERHQDEEDAKQEALVPGTGEPLLASLSRVLSLLRRHRYREVTGRSPEDGQSARFPRASSGPHCLITILVGLADSSSVCADLARMVRHGVPSRAAHGWRSALSPYRASR